MTCEVWDSGRGPVHVLHVLLYGIQMLRQLVLSFEYLASHCEEMEEDVIAATLLYDSLVSWAVYETLLNSKRTWHAERNDDLIASSSMPALRRASSICAAPKSGAPPPLRTSSARRSSRRKPS
jgi:hypothetical protein